MSLVTWVSVSLSVGWLSTLLMHRDLHRVSWCDFAVAVTGAGAAGTLLELCLGMPLTGPQGLSFPAALGCGCGATALLGAVNLARHGKLRPDPPRPRVCWRESLHGWQRSGDEP